MKKILLLLFISVSYLAQAQRQVFSLPNDYSANFGSSFTPRSIVDKNYIDSARNKARDSVVALIGSGSGITSLNTLTGATQTFATGTTGTDFGISSSGTTHTFNIPTASASNRGLLSATDWTTFNNKQAALTLTNTGNSGAATLDGSLLNIPIYAKPTLSKTMTIPAPTATDNFVIFFTPVAITVTKVADVVSGTSPSLTYDIHYGTDRSAAGTEVFGTDRVLTSTTGTTTTTFTNASVPANSFIWIKASAVSGTVNAASITIIYTEN